MSGSSKKLLHAAAGTLAASGGPLYVEDVFSTEVYAGATTTKNVVNNIDLSDEGGLVWFKKRTGTTASTIFDTETYASGSSYLRTNLTNGIANSGATPFVANSDGFSVTGNGGSWNANGDNYVSWSFRKAENFFDVVAWTGNGAGTRTVAHNLGSIPGMIIVKRTDAASDWIIYSSNGSIYKQMSLNSTAANNSDKNYSEIATDSALDVAHMEGSLGEGNANNETYVAYLFASDAGGFGDDGDENIIKCGGVTTGDSSTDVEVDLGFEPQWILMKNAESVSQWFLVDTMRGWISPTGVTNQAKPLFANLSNAESSGTNFVKPTATGFTVVSDNLGDSQDWIYMAIRRPMKTPTAATEVFAIGRGDEDADVPDYISGFPVDVAITKRVGAGDNGRMSSRLTGENYLSPNLTQVESGDDAATFDFMNGWGSDGSNRTLNEYGFMFKRAPGFMDAVAYSGSGEATTQAHNLGVAPELLIIKPRSLSYQWSVWSKDIASSSPYYEIVLNNNKAQYDGDNTNSPFSGVPSSTVFPLPSGTASASNRSGYTYIAYLFATLAGVSKVGSIAHSGTTDVACGFAGGARFVLAKRTDAAGGWFVWNSVGGIVAGNDPYVLLDTTAAEVTNTDYIDPLTGGFTFSDNFTDGTYLFFAIA